MSTFSLFASPWWVNLAILVPIIAYYFWRKRGLEIAKHILIYTAVFGIAFGFVEAAVVIHLRAATGFLPGYYGTLADVIHHASDAGQLQSLRAMPQSLFAVEFLREIATIVMLLCVAFLATGNDGLPSPFDTKLFKRAGGIFLWAFAFWDIFYYFWLWVLIRWPAGLTTPDVLFLVPVPWFAEVWFPILVSALTLGAILISVKKRR